MGRYFVGFILVVLFGIGLFMYMKKDDATQLKKVIILFGVPGTGKSTQGKMLQKELGIPHISTGDLLRSAVSSGSDLGMEAKSYMNKGSLVPDSLVVNILKERISKNDCSDGFLLDGFPRNVAQVEILDDMLRREGFTITYVLDIEITMDESVKRLGGRRVCSNCGTAYHIHYKSPKKEDICDRCQGNLVQRKDDKEDIIMKRFLEYEVNTAPVKEYYVDRDLLHSVNGTGEISEIYKNVLSKIQK